MLALASATNYHRIYVFSAKSLIPLWFRNSLNLNSRRDFWFDLKASFTVATASIACRS